MGKKEEKEFKLQQIKHRVIFLSATSLATIGPSIHQTLAQNIKDNGDAKVMSLGFTVQWSHTFQSYVKELWMLQDYNALALVNKSFPNKLLVKVGVGVNAQ